MKKKLWSAAATSVFLAAATLTAAAPSATAAPAEAQACTHPAWSNKSSGTGTAKGDTALVRTGPSADCAVTAEVGTDRTLYYHCWVTNSSGNKWTHVRIDGLNVNGWVYNGNLDDGGSQAPDNKC
ncbi:SH3 domain-containing protein [Streptomyces afghaniensis]|uniref:SH3 domain-containing protein n=1 Tax=Streptomyces afghaniensis TaxID=66865 RepID=UPI0027875E1D|nr:SH3 domain-containing protein [Streptomyces afghaniensis]MDQ1015172.1 hypothetical protein [Streptomyces afghaniensis]